MSLNLFPVRAPIGHADFNGQSLDVLMSPEFARALADLLERVGGADGSTGAVLALLAAFQPVAPSLRGVAAGGVLAASADLAGQVAALRRQVAKLRGELAMLPAQSTLHREIKGLRVQLGMIEDPGAAVRYLQTRKQNRITPGTATGSRAGNAALASLLTALAASGLVIDNTTP